MARSETSVAAGGVLKIEVPDLDRCTNISASARGGDVVVDGTTLVYLPRADFVGMDDIQYSAKQPDDLFCAGSILIDVVPAAADLDQLDLRLQDRAGQPVLRMQSSAPAAPLFLAIRNGGDAAVRVLQHSVAASISIRFRKGVLADDVIAALSGPAASDLVRDPVQPWRASGALPDDDDARAGVGFLLTLDCEGDDRTLGAGETLWIPLDGLSAKVEGGARPTRVEMCLEHKGAALASVTRTQALEIFDARPGPRPPLSVRLAGGAELDEGRDDNVLFLAVSNETDREFTGAFGAVPRLELAAVAAAVPWALCEPERTAGIAVTYHESGVGKSVGLDGPDPDLLARGEALWQTAFPPQGTLRLPGPGETAYLALRNVPGRLAATLPQALSLPPGPDYRMQPAPLELRWASIEGAEDGTQRVECLRARRTDGPAEGGVRRHGISVPREPRNDTGHSPMYAEPRLYPPPYVQLEDVPAAGGSYTRISIGGSFVAMTPAPEGSLGSTVERFVDGSFDPTKYFVPIPLPEECKDLRVIVVAKAYPTVDRRFFSIDAAPRFIEGKTGLYFVLTLFEGVMQIIAIPRMMQMFAVYDTYFRIDLDTAYVKVVPEDVAWDNQVYHSSTYHWGEYPGEFE